MSLSLPSVSIEESDSQGRLRILVVDDNCDAAHVLATLLELEGHHTNTAHNGLDAVHETAQGRYDAVLLDLGMPIMDGFQAAAKIRELQPAPLLIAHSAWDDPGTRARTAKLGFSAHLTKPAPFDDVLAALRAGRSR